MIWIYLFEKKIFNVFLARQIPIIIFENIHFSCSIRLPLPASVCEFAGGLATRCTDPGLRSPDLLNSQASVYNTDRYTQTPITVTRSCVIILILKLQMESWDSVPWSAYLHRPPGFSFQPIKLLKSCASQMVKMCTKFKIKHLNMNPWIIEGADGLLTVFCMTALLLLLTPPCLRCDHACEFGPL